MADLGQLLHEISLAFAASGHLRTLLPRLSEVLADVLPVVELEVIYLDAAEERAVIRTFAPRVRRSWQGARSARFFVRQRPSSTGWVADLEPARISSDSIEAQLEVPCGSAGMLRISFAVEPRALFEDRLSTDMLVDQITAQARRLGQLDTLARMAHGLHRKISEFETTREEEAESRGPAVTPEPVEPVEPVLRQTEIPLVRRSPPHTEMKVQPLDMALRECISGALRATSGRIYGDGGAAELLGLKPSTLQSKMRKLGIERRSFATRSSG